MDDWTNAESDIGVCGHQERSAEEVAFKYSVITARKTKQLGRHWEQPQLQFFVRGSHHLENDGMTRRQLHR